ncbi:DNA polymerase epsilon subunit 2-like [Liolophura sinensis]|uniref:DNA polymerase epsilon subunit 2-like n=1 Tax=Liolophura sinensis TaxID=3198878 RepID=UPI003159074C
MASHEKSRIVSNFKMHGLTPRSEASKYLVEVLGPLSPNAREKWLDKIIECLLKQSLKSALVDRAACEAAVKECNAEHSDDSENAFLVIDAFSVPRFTYVSARKRFLPNSELAIGAPTLHGSASDKVNLFREHYAILHQRTARHELFTPPAVGTVKELQNRKFQLKPIEYLLGSSTKMGEIIVLGMLSQLKEGKWFLEDPTGVVQLDLSKANFHSGLFTENCFVLAEGKYEDEVFHVNAFGFPPPEPAKQTCSFFGNINFFGGPSPTSARTSVKLKQLEENADSMLVFLSDVWLDDTRVMDKLRLLFSGYAEFPPTCFVFCGNFLSASYGNSHSSILKENLQSLGNLISEYKELVENSRFVFVPGPNDCGMATILPRTAIPSCLTTGVTSKLPTAVFASNPCRIQYCTQEIVVFREDIVTKMCRNCVKFPTDNNIPSHFAKTVISQGHLSPLPLHVSPVYWAYDNALRIYPLPDLIVCADKFDPFYVMQTDTTVMNPGSFPRTGFSFKVYLPASRQIEDSKIEE